MADFPYSMDGPHSPEQVKAAVELAAEAVRYLNLATRAGSDGLEYPSDVYDLLGSLVTLAERLPQLLTQLTGFLDAGLLEGRVGADAGDPANAVARCALWLGAADGHARSLAADLQGAQNAISGLHAKGGNDGQ